MTKHEEIIIFPRYTIKTKSWSDRDGNLIVTWADIMLVYPDFGGSNAK